METYHIYNCKCKRLLVDEKQSLKSSGIFCLSCKEKLEFCGAVEIDEKNVINDNFFFKEEEK
jgi:hypothetical protein